MSMYNNIEAFYSENSTLLIKGEMRPVVSYNKDAEEYILKLVSVYKSNNCPKEITLKQIEKGLGVSSGSNVASVESPLTWISLGLVEETDCGKNKKDPNYTYRFTPEFEFLASCEMVPGVHILNKLFAVKTLQDITKFINLLICTLREGYIEDGIIDFPRDNSNYVAQVPEEQNRLAYSQRINKIYGYPIDTNSSPHASMRAINNLVKLELIKQNGTTPEGFVKYELTSYAHRLLQVIDQNFDKNKTSIANIKPVSLEQPLQQIYYGAPGTGKSHKTNEVASLFPETIRTTFHPDSDYSTFVGAYKPTMEEVDVKTVPVVIAGGITLDQNKGTYKEKKISYKFVKQAFLKAYVKAWKFFKETCADGQDLKPQFLIVEEINRGNCAQIFGDLFQLLDRKHSFSEYPIEADEDIRKALLEEDTDENPSFGGTGLLLSEEQKAFINKVYDNKPIAEKICSGQLLVLPPNLYIWATMNTSDQSLFPIDSAFKRRWEWKYMKIKQGYKKDEQGNLVLDTGGNKVPLGWQIEIKGEDQQIKLTQDWWAFIQKVNLIIASMTSSADKQLGYFFCKADKDGVISAETFVSKVIFYLWNDVFKDYGFDDASLFRYKVKEGEKEVEKDLTFPDFYDEDGEKVNAERLVDFIQKVMAWQKPEDNA